MMRTYVFQLCVWDANEWENICSKFLENLHTGVVPETPVVSHIQFHPDQIHLLVVHEWQIDVFEAPTLNLVTQVLYISQNYVCIYVVCNFVTEIQFYYSWCLTNQIFQSHVPHILVTVSQYMLAAKVDA